MKKSKPLPPGVVAGQPVNSQGSYYAADGTFMNADGSRSIFDDIDDDGEADDSADDHRPSRGLIAATMIGLLLYTLGLCIVAMWLRWMP